MNRSHAILILFFFLVPWYCFALSPAALAGDPYEPDNSFREAQDIGIDDIDQVHTFHSYFDQDWIRFTAMKGVTYAFKTEYASSNCDPVLELFAPDGTTRLKRVNEADIGSNELLLWICPADGAYYFRFTNDSQYYDSSVQYRITGTTVVSGPTFPGYLSGRVTCNGVGIQAVSLQSEKGAATSLSDGSYILGLKEGQATVTVHKDGYQSQSFTVTIAQNLTTHRDVALERIAETNTPPTITGIPETEAKAGTLYSFRPQSDDQEGDNFIFSIANNPSWLHFNPEDGRLLGIPEMENIGLHGPITMTVTDSRGAGANLPPFTIEVLKCGFVPGSLLLLIK